ncbi:hypothetical protein ACO0K2_11775 [Undibacterium sp. MH2W]|uniref:hypothetical protein n=1 Tax=Undibacterium sp. MH2W TaxID=3413044 RepID=UPI003BEFC16E
MAFDKAALFAALKPKTSTTIVEGFGDVTLKQLKVAETDDIRAKIKANGDTSQFGLELLVLSVVDEKGTPVFSESDIPAIKDSSNAPIENLIGVALELNGFKKAAEAKN